MSDKLIDNNRRAHAAKVLAKSSKKNTTQAEETDINQAAGVKPEAKKSTDALNEQYKIIRGDLLRLREDLSHGFDLLKDFLETQISRRTLVKSK